jgi:hypothetical protein
MKKLLILALVIATLIWLAFAAILLGAYQPAWLPTSFLSLAKPSSLADFGQAFSALDGLISSFALMLGLIAVVIQAKQSADSNVIGAFSARLQYLLADSDRLEQQIQALKGSVKFDQNLFNNMVEKKKRQLDEAKSIDEKI